MKDFKPICIRFVKETSKGLKYETQDHDVDLELSRLDRKLAIDFLYFCTGRERLEEIAKELNVKIAKLLPLINILVEHKVILDSREFYRLYHEFGSIPGPFTRQTQNIIPKTFSDEKVDLSRIMKTFAGLTLHTGAYPLEFFILLNHDYGKFKSGLYKFNTNKRKLISLSKKTTVKLNKFLLSADLAENSSAIIFTIADYKKLNQINANREYRYLYLESGRVAQNIKQLASKEKVSVVESGEFNDKAVASFLGLDILQFCTNTLILGKEKKELMNGQSSQVQSLQDKVSNLKEFLQKKKILKGIEVKMHLKDEYFMQKYATMAMSQTSVNRGKPSVSCGVAETIVESELKCLVEMYERYVCSLVRVDREIVFSNQKNFFSITLAAPQHKTFLRKRGLQRIDVGKKVKCINATGLVDNKKYLVPVDEVFFPYKDAKYYKANSSGVAAHHDRDLAIKNALYELIERDALLVTWYAKKVPKILENSCLPEDVKMRVENLRKKNAKVFFLDITIDSCPVILCLVQSPVYPRTSTGCSANLDMDKAIEKSLDEAELMYNTWSEESGTNKFVAMKDVESVIDHGNIFARVNLSESSYKWILSGKHVKRVTSPIGDFEGLLKKFDPIVIDINKKQDLGIFVVRVMSRKLLPLTFGYGAEHYGHSRLKELDFNWCSEYPSLPHFIP